MSRLPNDAKLFVDGIVDFLKSEKKHDVVVPKVKKLLVQVAKRDDEDNKAYVESSIGLTDNEKGSIVQILTKIRGHEVTPIYRINPALLAGIRIEMGGLVIDTSFAHQLSAIIDAVK